MSQFLLKLRVSFDKIVFYIFNKATKQKIIIIIHVLKMFYLSYFKKKLIDLKIQKVKQQMRYNNREKSFKYSITK